MAASKCCVVSTCQMPGHAGRDQAVAHVSLANAIAHLNTVSAGVSVEPADYNWGTPSVLQQQALYAQFFQLALMCSLPQMQYAHLSSLQAARPAMFPSFLPSFPGSLLTQFRAGTRDVRRFRYIDLFKYYRSGFVPPMTAPSSAPSPFPASCSQASPQASGPQVRNCLSRCFCQEIGTPPHDIY